MTVSTLTNRVTYIGNGAATSFAVPFKVLDEDHLVVERRLISTNEIDHTYVGTEYSYSGIGADAGTLTLDGAALSSLYQLEIERIVPYTQELDIVNSGGFYPETVEEQLDLTTMQVQQIAAQSDDIKRRAFMVPEGETAPDYGDFADYLAAHPAPSYLNADIVTPAMMGAIDASRQDWVMENGAQALPPDNLAALQEFFEYCATSHREFIPNFRGVWGINGTLTVDQSRGIARQFQCGTLVALAPMTDMMVLSHSYSRMEGCLGLVGAGVLDDWEPYGSRTVDNGLRLVYSNNAYIEEIRVASFKEWGVYDEPNSAISDNILLKIGYVRGFGCGAFHLHADGKVEVAFTARADSGLTVNPGQRSTLTVASSAPLKAMSWVEIDGKPYLLTDIVNATSVKVYPWLPSGVTTGTIKSMHGGTVKFGNNNSTLVRVDRIDSFYAGAMFWSNGLYGASVGDGQSQSNSISYALGSVSASENKINRGSIIEHPHSEGNEYDLIIGSPASTFEIGESPCWGQDGDVHRLSRTVMLRPLVSGTFAESPFHGITDGGIKYGGKEHSAKSGYIGSYNNADATISNEQPSGTPVFLNNNFDVYLDWREDYNRLFPGNASAEAIIIGTGANREPTGTVTVEPTPAQVIDGYTVNGGASVSITGATARLHIVAIKEDGTDNWIVSW